MYKLYYSPGACSLATHVILNELNVPFEAIRKSTKDGSLRSPDFLKLNPRGQVPLLVAGDTPVKEGAAMITWLLDTHKSPLLPQSGIERAKGLEWLMWANATLHPVYSRAFWLMRQEIDEKSKATLNQATYTQIQSLWDEAEERLGQTPFLGGEAIGPADILITVISQWGVGHEFKFGPNLQRVFKEVQARPSWQKASAAEKAEAKAA